MVSEQHFVNYFVNLSFALRKAICFVSVSHSSSFYTLDELKMKKFHASEAEDFFTELEAEKKNASINRPDISLLF